MELDPSRLSGVNRNCGGGRRRSGFQRRRQRSSCHQRRRLGRRFPGSGTHGPWRRPRPTAGRRVLTAASADRSDECPTAVGRNEPRGPRQEAAAVAATRRISRQVSPGARRRARWVGFSYRRPSINQSINQLIVFFFSENKFLQRRASQAKQR